MITYVRSTVSIVEGSGRHSQRCSQCHPRERCKAAMAETLRDDPRTSINWHIHRAGCPNYRERWFADTDLQAGEPLYQVFCLLNTPPVSAEEQNKCLRSHN